MVASDGWGDAAIHFLDHCVDFLVCGLSACIGLGGTSFLRLGIPYKEVPCVPWMSPFKGLRAVLLVHQFLSWPEVINFQWEYINVDLGVELQGEREKGTSFWVQQMTQCTACVMVSQLVSFPKVQNKGDHFG